MTFAWTEQLAMGIDMIDEQHRELFRRAQRFLDAFESRSSVSELLRLLGFLGEYVVTHFTDEEALMVERGYAGRAEHAAEHAGFIETFQGLRNDFARSGATPSLEAAVKRDVCDWLVRHIDRTDRILAASLRGAPAGTPAVR